MQLARQLAETVARVHDPLMRSEVISKVAARLGVGTADFSHAPAEAATRPNARGTTDEPIAPAPRHEIAMLCLLALRHTEARDFLCTQDWPEVLAETPGGEMLATILGSDLRPDEPGIAQPFHVLAPRRRGVVSLGLAFTENAAKLGEAVARDWWQGLRRRLCAGDLHAAESRLSCLSSAPARSCALQKQVVDLRGRLDQFSPFSPPKALES